MVKTNPLGALAAVGGALLAVGLLVLMLVVVEARPAGATFPGQNGRIAYQSIQDGDYEIYTINPTGGTPVQVTKNDTYDSEPSYSPNGEKIAYTNVDYTGATGTDSEIYKIPHSGGMPVKVTNNRRFDFAPSYSPNGRKIAYTGDDGDDYEIYKIHHNGGTPVKVTDTDFFSDDRYPSWGSRP